MEKSAKAVYITVFIIILVVVGYFVVVKKNVNEHSENVKSKELSNLNIPDSISINVNGNKYKFVLEKNKTVEEFIKMCPLTLDMKDKTAESKSAMIYSKLTTSKTRLKNIDAGDVILDGDSTVVLYTKSTKISGKYTKLGHIENFKYSNDGRLMLYFAKQ